MVSKTTVTFYHVKIYEALTHHTESSVARVVVFVVTPHVLTTIVLYKYKIFVTG